MRRVLKWLAWILAGIIGILAVLVAVIFFANNTGPGQRMLGNIISGVTGGQVTSNGDPFWSPSHLHFDHLQLHDKQGVYLDLNDITIDWSILALIHRKAEINKLTVGSATLERIPQSMSMATSQKKASSSSSLPVTVVLHKLVVEKLKLAPAVAGKAYTLKLEGSGTLNSYTSGQGQLTATEIGGPAVYKLSADVNDKKLDLTVNAKEPAHGLIASLANLPQLGAIDIDAKLHGPRDAIATNLAVTAGQLNAKAQGTVDLTDESADLTVAANAPAMQPRPDLSWQSIALQAQVHGKFSKPNVDGHLTIDQLKAYGGGAQRLAADVSGNQGLVHVKAQADQLTIPGSHPDLLAGAPLKLDATAHLAEANRPIDFSVEHPLLTANGSAQTAGTLQARVHLVIPHLQPFAQVAGAKLQGHTTLDLTGSKQDGTTHLAVSGVIGLKEGTPPAPSLIGSDAHIDTAVDLHGQDLTIRRFTLNGENASAAVHGSVAGGNVDLAWALGLTDLSAVQPTLQGQIHANGHIGGTTQDLTVAADLNGDVTAQGYQSGHFTAHLQAKGLPKAPSGQITAQGSLLGAPVQLAVAAQKLANGAYHVAIDRAAWKSAHAQGELTVNPPALVPTGQLSFAMTRLADLDPLLHQRLAGSVEATLDATTLEARLTAKIDHAAMPGTASVRRMNLHLAIANPTTQPVVNGELVLNDFSAGSIGGSATVKAHGPEDALGLQVAATLPRLYGASAGIHTKAVVNVPKRALTLDTLRADWKQVALRLQQPARIAQVPGGIAVQHLRMAVDRGELTVDGRVGKTLDLTADLNHLPASIVTVVSPSMAARGTISARAHLTGPASSPDGTIHLEARQVQLRSGPGQAIPPANLTANADLRNGEAQVDARLGVGKSNIRLAGTAPVTGKGALNLRTTGAVDLAMLDPLLAANGRRVTGRLNVDARITGSVSKPLVAGRATLANGDVQDFNYGVHLRDIAATLQGNGEHLRLSRFTAKAGPGTLSGSGTIGLTAPMPVDLTFTAHNATPISNDILTERLDANLKIAGDIQGTLGVRGNVHVLHADIQIPDKLPKQVAVIPVRNPNAPPKPPQKSGPAMTMALDLTITAREVFVRGHGLDADLAGRIHVGGTSANPQPSGGLALQQGTFSMAGTTLDFTEGTVDFIGAGISDPALHFVAQTVANNITATLTVGGTARAPTISLSSVPELPQDEILAQILFGRSISSLSPFQVAQVAAAVASFTGVTSGLDPLNNLRKSLGLDRLSIGTSATGSPTVQGGRYLAPGVYLGAKQNATGSGTQAQLQIDIAKGLKLDTTAGTGSTSATGAASSGQEASVGLTYQFQY